MVCTDILLVLKFQMEFDGASMERTVILFLLKAKIKTLDNFKMLGVID